MEKKSEISSKIKKSYKKPEAKKHKSAALVSGSCDCSYYSRRTCGDSYYH
jgi:hypothetical protein